MVYGEGTVLLHVGNAVGHSPKKNPYLSFPVGLGRPYLLRQKVYPASFNVIHKVYLEMLRDT